MGKIVYKRYSNIPKMFAETVQNYSKKIALKYFVGNEIRGITFEEYWEKSRNIAGGLLSLQFQKGDHIALFSETRFEWCVADIGILLTGAATITLFHTLEYEQARFIIEDSESCAIIVSNAELLDRILKVWKKLPKLKYILIIENSNVDLKQYCSDAEIEIYSPRIFSLDQIIARGKKFLKDYGEDLSDRINNIQENDLASIIYTSGTTGIPKGVMLSHKNLISDVIMGAIALRPPTDEVSITYLPLAHSFAHLVEHLGCCLKGATLFLQRIILVSQKTFMTFIQLA
jgi:long-chain acyl-CoA synthetase